jgi:hypothetical protein
LLKSVDLPTLGRPTMAMVERFSPAMPDIELDLILVNWYPSGEAIIETRASLTSVRH